MKILFITISSIWCYLFGAARTYSVVSYSGSLSVIQRKLKAKFMMNLLQS